MTMTEQLQPMDDILILDIATFIAGPFAAVVLVEFGARVIKIEKPGEGDFLRQLGTAIARQPRLQRRTWCTSSNSL